MVERDGSSELAPNVLLLQHGHSQPSPLLGSTLQVPTEFYAAPPAAIKQ